MKVAPRARGRRPKASSEGTRERLGRTAAARYGDLIAWLWVCGSGRGSGITVLCPLVWPIGSDWVASTMRFGDACGAECDAGHVFGRAAAYPVTDQRKALGGWGAECFGFAHEVSILIAVGR